MYIFLIISNIYKTILHDWKYSVTLMTFPISRSIFMQNVHPASHWTRCQGPIKPICHLWVSESPSLHSRRHAMSRPWAGHDNENIFTQYFLSKLWAEAEVGAESRAWQYQNTQQCNVGLTPLFSISSTTVRINCDGSMHVTVFMYLKICPITYINY